MPRIFILPILLFISICSRAAPGANPDKTDFAQQKWVDSVYARLNEAERIGQLFMVDVYSGGPNYNVPKIETLLRNHQIGGLIYMQGGPVRQAMATNKFQKMAQVPLLISMDAEWGLGMRLDSVLLLPKAMTLGAADDSGLTYLMGAAVANQCSRLGVHVAFAPVVDVNNNPGNPVINARSFGEDKYKVARLGIAYMHGLQDNGVMACAKHFPGHGDVTVDSHKDLPVINKSKAELDSLELYPFREMIKAGVQSMMIAHLSVPVLEKEPNVPTTLSKSTVTGLLKNELGFKGLTFTDAMNMKGVTKYFPDGETDLRAFMAGNDVLLFTQDVPKAIAKIQSALKEGRIKEDEIEKSVKRILAAKYQYGLSHFTEIDTNNITNDLNRYTIPFNTKVDEAAITVVRDRQKMIPLKQSDRVLEVFVGGEPSLLARGTNPMTKLGGYAAYTIPKGGSCNNAEEKMASERWDVIIIRVQGLGFYPGKSYTYGLDDATIRFLEKVSKKPNVLMALMGNAYALKYVCDAGTLVCAYEDNPWTGIALDQLLSGNIKQKGTLPVTPPCLK